MAYSVIQNCSITHQDSSILLPYIDTTESIAYRLNNYSYNPGIDIQCTTIFTPCNAVVIQVAIESDNTYMITLQYSTDICLRFTNVVEPYVSSGDLIKVDTEIGRCNGYVHFELLTTQPGKVLWSVWIDPLKLYKNDPIQVFDGTIVFDNTVTLEYSWPEKYFVESYPPGYVGGDG